MKTFLRNIAASFFGTLLALGVMAAIAMTLVLSAVVSASVGETPKVKPNSLLHISLTGVIEEQATDSPLATILGKADKGTQGLSTLLTAIERAKENKNVKGIFIEAAGSVSTEPATLQALRDKLVDFAESGKPIYAYGDEYSQGAYYVCSAAQTVALHYGGNVVWKGLASEPMFFKDVLEKLGVKVQVFKVGTYKSAVEPFISTEMSPANREQVTAYMNSIWSHMVADVAASRKLSADTLQAYADMPVYMQSSEDLVDMKLIDKVVYRDSVRRDLKLIAGIDVDDKLNLIGAEDLAATDAENAYTKNDAQVAVYYAYGDIVDQSEVYSQAHAIVGDEVVADLEKLAADDDVKAVVLRVNSGGGSAFASEKMWYAIRDLNKKKPVVVSMGGMAASGGYYMSSPARRIFAEPTTLTGSIGIFGMIPDVSKLVTEKIGLRFDAVSTNAHGTFGTMSRPMTADECAMVQTHIERGYARFLDRVSQGRHMTVEAVDSIGQGRVWTGEQAVKLGLVDELGNLSNAIAYAASEAGLEEGKYSVTDAPTQAPWYESLLDMEKKSYYEEHLRAALGQYAEPLSILHAMQRREFVQARIPFVPNIY